MSWLFFGPPRGIDATVPGEGQDPLTNIWYLAWWPFAIVHGIDPLISEFVWAPSGYNLAWGTSLPTAALLAAPITLTAGPVAALGVLMVAAPGLSAFAAFLLIREVSPRFAAAVIGGLLFGFSSYENGQMLGHLNLALNFPIPLLVLLVVRRMAGRIGVRLFVPLVLLVLLLEFGLSNEMFASMISLGSIVFLIFVIAGPEDQRPRLLRVGGELAIAGSCCGLVLLPYLLTMVAGSSEFSGFVNSPETYSSDLLNLVVPTGVTRLGRSVFAGLAYRFTGNASEQGAYLGVPLLLILIAFAWQRRGNRSSLALVLSFGAVLLASFGPLLHVGGWNTGLVLPWRIATNLPLIKGALPGRFSVYAALAASVAAALWIGEGGSRRGALLRLGMGGIACLFLLPNTEAVAWSRAPSLPVFAPDRIVREIGPARTILVLPFGVTGPSMFWQVQSGFAFRQAGGYLSFMPKSFERLAIVLALLRGAPDENFASDLASFCATHDVSAIVAGPGTSDALLAALRGLGWAFRSAGGATVFDVPDADDLRYVTLTGNTWPSGSGTWQLAGRQVGITTHRIAARISLANTLLPDGLPLEVELSHDQAHELRLIGPRETITMDVPPDTEWTIRPQRSFRPGDRSGAEDRRDLSMQLEYRASSP